MADWAQWFEEHPVLEALGEAEETLVSVGPQVEEAGDLTELDFDRIGHLLRRTRQEVEAVDPLAATQAQLNSATTSLRKGTQELANFAGNGTGQHLENASTHFENAIVQAGLVPKIQHPVQVESLQEAVVSFRRSVGQHLRNVEADASGTRERLGEIREALEALQAAIAKEKTRTDEALRRFEAQFSEAEAERRKESQGYWTNLQGQISEVESRFLAAQETRQERFAELLETQTTRGKAAVDQIVSGREALESDYQAAVQRYLDDLEAQKEAAVKIVGAVAQTGMVGGYQKIANSEQLATRVWQAITISSILGHLWSSHREKVEDVGFKRRFRVG